MLLSPDQIKPYLSPYLMGGWRDDEMALQQVDVEPGCIRGVVQVTDYFMPGDGVFHLTVPSVFIWFAQLAIVYGCWEQKLSKKPGEIFVRDIQIKCKRPVTSTEGIEFVLTLSSKRRVAEGVFYAGNFSVDREAFVGSGKFLLPLSASF